MSLQARIQTKEQIQQIVRFITNVYPRLSDPSSYEKNPCFIAQF